MSARERSEKRAKVINLLAHTVIRLLASNVSTNGKRDTSAKELKRQVN